MTPLTQIELNTTTGGYEAMQDFNWGQFVDTVGWFLGVGCGVSGGNPAICGAAIVVNGVDFFFF